MRAGYFGESVRDAAIAKAYLHPEMTVADIGTGTGFVATGLAPLVRQVVAVDGSAAMLEAAQRNLSGLANVTTRLADGAALPFEDGSLDAVFTNMYLHHCPDPQAAIAEMVRVLRPGGRLVITDLDQHEHEWMRREMADEWLGFDRGQIKAWLRGAGLVNVIVDCTNQSCSATSQTVGAAAEVSIRGYGQPAGKRARSGPCELWGVGRKRVSCRLRGCTEAQSSCCSSSTPWGS
jgi:SAM-dependent methyltransferase